MKHDQRAVLVSDKTITLDKITAVAEVSLPVEVSTDREFVNSLQGSVDTVNSFLDRGRPVYGVTTGYGSSCGNRITTIDIKELGENLIRYHGCGTGEPLSVAQTRAAMFCRMICLAKGYSGISHELLKRFADFLNHRITPVIPSEGSVGASGDLTPLSYVAACLVGDREVIYEDRCILASQAISEAGLPPYSFKPKEPLAIMNGTSVMTGIAILALARSRRILKAATAATALCVHGLRGHIQHYHSTIFEAKPFPGQGEVASWLRALLQSDDDVTEATEPDCFQDPYSIRCAPQVLGVLADAMRWIGPWVENEANSANDNPIIDTSSEQILMGGNFYGGHIAFAMDGLKTALASLCDLSDRLIALVVDPRFSRGLPANLTLEYGDEAMINHGFKGLQITATALTAEAQKMAMPAAVFSRSTESHNQDKVSLGTIAARDADRICALAQRTVSIHLLVGARSCRLREGIEARPALADLVHRIEEFSPPYSKDRPMDEDIEKLARAIGAGTLWK